MDLHNRLVKGSINGSHLSPRANFEDDFYIKHYPEELERSNIM